MGQSNSLMNAIKSGNVNRVSKIIKKNSTTTNELCMILCYIILTTKTLSITNKSEITKLLLDEIKRRNCQLFNTYSYNGYQIVNYAFKHSNKTCIKYFLTLALALDPEIDSNACVIDFNMLDISGHDPLYYMCKDTNLEVIELLLHAGANPYTNFNIFLGSSRPYMYTDPVFLRIFEFFVDKRAIPDNNNQTIMALYNFLMAKIRPEQSVDEMKFYNTLGVLDTKQTDVCPICYEEFTNGTERVITLGAATNVVVSLKKCGHIFHKKCINEWIIKGMTSVGSNVGITCPICRTKLNYGRIIRSNRRRRLGRRLGRRR